MKRVLIVSFFFPPFNTIGAVRIGKLAKYLPEFGWTPLVLTVEDIDTLPKGLAVELPVGRIVRTPYWDFRTLARNTVTPAEGCTGGASGDPKGKHPFRVSLGGVYRALRKLLPLSDDRMIDYASGWYPQAVRAGKHLLESEPIDAIFSSSGPPTCHLIAGSLARKSGKPWLADYRDLWSQNHTTRRRQPFQFLEEHVESAVVRAAGALLTVSEPLAVDLQRLHGNLVHVLPNGFDPEDYAQAGKATLGKFTITYTGNINPETRNPVGLFQAVRALKQVGKVTADRFEVRFFGASLGPVMDLAREHGIADLVSVHRQVPFAESVARQKESTVLLVLEWNHPSAQGVYTGKLFEYLGAGRPILATGVEGGVMDRLLQDAGSGVLVNDTVKIRDVLEKWLTEFAEAGEVRSHWMPVSRVVDLFDRRKQAGRLADILNELVR